MAKTYYCWTKCPCGNLLQMEKKTGFLRSDEFKNVVCSRCGREIEGEDIDPVVCKNCNEMVDACGMDTCVKCGADLGIDHSDVVYVKCDCGELNALRWDGADEPVRRYKNTRCYKCRTKLFAKEYTIKQCPSCKKTIGVKKDVNKCPYCNKPFSEVIATMPEVVAPKCPEEYILFEHPKNEFGYNSQLIVSEGTKVICLQNGACKDEMDPGAYNLNKSKLSLDDRMLKPDVADGAVYHTQILCMNTVLDSMDLTVCAPDIGMEDESGIRKYNIFGDVNVVLEVLYSKKFAELLKYKSVLKKDAYPRDPQEENTKLRAEFKENDLARHVRQYAEESIRTAVNKLVTKDGIKPTDISSHQDECAAMMQSLMDEKLDTIGLRVRIFAMQVLHAQETAESKESYEKWAEDKKTGKTNAEALARRKEDIISAAETSFNWETENIRISARGNDAMYVDCKFKGTCKMRLIPEKKDAYLELSEVKDWIREEETQFSKAQVTGYYAGHVSDCLYSFLSQVTRNMVEQVDVDLRQMNRYFGILSDQVLSFLNGQISGWGLRVESVYFDPAEIKESESLKLNYSYKEERSEAELRVEMEKFRKNNGLEMHQIAEDAKLKQDKYDKDIEAQRREMNFADKVHETEFSQKTKNLQAETEMADKDREVKKTQHDLDADKAQNEAKLRHEVEMQKLKDALAHEKEAADWLYKANIERRNRDAEWAKQEEERIHSRAVDDNDKEYQHESTIKADRMNREEELNKIRNAAEIQNARDDIAAAKAEEKRKLAHEEAVEAQKFAHEEAMGKFADDSALQDAQDARNTKKADDKRIHDNTVDDEERARRIKIEEEQRSRDRKNEDEDRRHTYMMENEDDLHAAERKDRTYEDLRKDFMYRSRLERERLEMDLAIDDLKRMARIRGEEEIQQHDIKQKKAEHEFDKEISIDDAQTQDTIDGIMNKIAESKFDWRRKLDEYTRFAKQLGITDERENKRADAENDSYIGNIAFKDRLNHSEAAYDFSERQKKDDFAYKTDARKTDIALDDMEAGIKENRARDNAKFEQDMKKDAVRFNAQMQEETAKFSQDLETSALTRDLDLDIREKEFAEKLNAAADARTRQATADEAERNERMSRLAFEQKMTEKRDQTMAEMEKLKLDYDKQLKLWAKEEESAKLMEETERLKLMLEYYAKQMAEANGAETARRAAEMALKKAEIEYQTKHDELNTAAAEQRMKAEEAARKDYADHAYELMKQMNEYENAIRTSKISADTNIALNNIDAGVRIEEIKADTIKTVTHDETGAETAKAQASSQTAINQAQAAAQAVVGEAQAAAQAAAVRSQQEASREAAQLNVIGQVFSESKATERDIGIEKEKTAQVQATTQADAVKGASAAYAAGEEKILNLYGDLLKRRDEIEERLKALDIDRMKNKDTVEANAEVEVAKAGVAGMNVEKDIAEMLKNERKAEEEKVNALMKEMSDLREKMIGSLKGLEGQMKELKDSKYCPKCHAQVSATSKYCAACGFNLNGGNGKDDMLERLVRILADTKKGTAPFEPAPNGFGMSGFNGNNNPGTANGNSGSFGGNNNFGTANGASGSFGDFNKFGGNNKF